MTKISVCFAADPRVNWQLPRPTLPSSSNSFAFLFSPCLLCTISDTMRQKQVFAEKVFREVIKLVVLGPKAIGSCNATNTGYLINLRDNASINYTFATSLRRDLCSQYILTHTNTAVYCTVYAIDCSVNKNRRFWSLKKQHTSCIF